MAKISISKLIIAIIPPLLIIAGTALLIWYIIFNNFYTFVGGIALEIMSIVFLNFSKKDGAIQKTISIILITLSVPLLMIDGIPKPIIEIFLILSGLTMIYLIPRTPDWKKKPIRNNTVQ